METRKKKNKPLVGIIMGSDSDLRIMNQASEFLDKSHVPYEMEIVSAHRTPELMFDYAKTARKRGLKVIIAGAGGSAHLPGMIASLTTLPVIGVPIESHNLKGMDSLLSIVQMPSGIPVACVAINGAINAAILACQILALSSNNIAYDVEEFRKNLYNSVIKKRERLKKK
ncbi:MAG TPA: 5-(carboxyamino)imidazole ribonucleotide mutase [Nitrososphaeraceae archaeon]|nr:5-(carboxyamino)imidazole ribonucleotide mutase [Nitrososphaeraceae archaeon]